MLFSIIAHAVAAACTQGTSVDPHDHAVDIAQPSQIEIHETDRLDSRSDDPHCQSARPAGGNKPVTGTVGVTTPLVPLVPVYDPNNPGAGQIGQADLTPVAPRLSFGAFPSSVAIGASAQLLWEGEYVDECVAGGAWDGRLPIEGMQNTLPLTQNSTFTLNCTGPLGNVEKVITVVVGNGPAAPIVTLTADPQNVSAGQTSTLSWTSQNADSCVGSGAWGGFRPLSGSVSTRALSQSSVFTLVCSGPGGNSSDSATVTVSTGPLPPVVFNKITIEQDRGTWGKGFADLDGDGDLDIMEGGGMQGTNVYWYRNPGWQRFQIGSQSGGDDIKAGDINGDGALDILVSGIPTAWYENPAGSGGNPQGTWQRRVIAEYRAHDVELVDMNDDGKLDVVMRIADTAFPATRIHLQGDGNDWPLINLWGETRGFGGLAVADIDDDGRLDVVGDGYWLRQPAPADIMDGNNWTRYDIASWPTGSSIDVADINKDGRLDVSLAVSEVGVGDFAWFEAPANPLTQSWIRHPIDIVEDVHRHHLIDFNGDGELDIVFAEMYQSDDDRVGVYYNQGNGASWILDILETHASHNLAVGDVDNDGDIDFLGSNWRINNAPASGDLFLWINQDNP